jgi:glutamine synthetase
MTPILDRDPAPLSAEEPLPAARLVRLIGKSPDEWTLDDLIRLATDAGIRLVSLMHVGGDASLKTLDFAPRDARHLREILIAGERADGSSLFPGMGIPVGSSDIILRPRLSTAFIDPFATEPTLVVLAAHHARDGCPLPQSPDTLVHIAAERVRRETGVELSALGEIEFFLGKRPEEHDVAAAADRGYHASAPFVFGQALRRQALVVLADIGVPIKYGHGEVGHILADEMDARLWEQHEVELGLQPLPRAADSVVLTQWVLRNLAHRAGMRCSFEPILRKGHAGSGMHFHLSPVGAGGVHLPHTSTAGDLAPEAKWLIAGLVTCGGALMAFGNRSTNSFIRLIQAKEAPNTMMWGRYNRHALVRLPIVATDSGGRAVGPETIEFRLPDGSAHPHLLLAAIAQAMVAGRQMPDIDEIIERTASHETAAPLGFTVPKSPAEVSALLGRHRDVIEAGGVFPRAMIDRLMETLASA